MIRVLLAEDMNLIRGALVALLGLEPDMEVVAEVSSGDSAVSEALRHRPDVAVLDINMPGGIDGLAAAAVLAERLPDCRVLILTSLGRPEMLRRALSAEVRGFMLKDAPPAELAGAIRRVAGGERVMDPQLAAAAITGRRNPLSPREVEVLRMASEGAEPAEIASRLHLTKGTVRNYLGAIVTKLDARNRLDAVRIATEADWL
ncbi:response regulator transcription factor [Streptosporangium roseum]|uniref:Response regulator receiver protein n=1 Tax=Streptosporangium roseum (strain ATCC 12428 / DSM 43021 / JCM 3005 / KCTC 9067 / NCIMB 10171 / NRRL 2505 / NI 9100) TaxID=479432 RepID=D2AX74_STRRD|nr:response regulator transcription factor [Streptosporangium roseum]ACZ90801.1 response regulator receiver protein [Streptosporangium roseum DSM 43021]